jgi:hypothetical protein
MDSKVVAG